MRDDARGMHLPSTFRALRHRNYRLFFFGQMISLTGTWMQIVAQRWLVYRLTGSTTMLGTINLVAGLPLVPVALWVVRWPTASPSAQFWWSPNQQ